MKNYIGIAHLLTKIIKNLPESLWELKINQCVDFAIKNIDNPNKQVRNAFHNFIV